MKLLRLNQKGIAHILAPVLFIAIFGAIGGYVLLKSQAASVPDSNSREQSSASNLGIGARVHRPTLLKSHLASGVSAPRLTLLKTQQRGQTLAPASSARNSPDCYEGGACYYYVYAYQHHITATGVSAYFYQAKPHIDRNEYHTTVQMAIYRYDHNDIQQDIEYGWTVEPITYHDSKPHLFVDWIVNGYYFFGCRKGCGFVSNPKARIHVGDVVKTGVKAKYEVKFAHHHWEVFYNNKLIGHLPASLWKNASGGKFDKIHYADLYGEVEVPFDDYKPHSQMGNGRYGTSKNSASISHYSLVNSKDKPSLHLYADSYPRAYNHGKHTATSLYLGGPGV